MTAPPTLDVAQQVLAAQPFSAALGTVISQYDEAGTVLELPVQPQFLQQHGYVHGGILCYLPTTHSRSLEATCSAPIS